jgi:hypothetical protein
VKEKLLRKSSELQIKFGRRVDLNEAIDYLISHSGRRPDLLERACRPISPASTNSNFESAYSELMAERRKDEARAKRRYGV